MGKLDGKVAVVTGRQQRHRPGHRQAVRRRGAPRSSSPAAGRRSSTRRSPRSATGAIGVQGDVSKLADLDRLYATVKEKHGRVDVLFANAGGGEFAPLGEITEEHFDSEFGINVKGLLFTVQKALPLFTDGGSIILNASIVSIKGMPAFSVYSATKAAVRSFARTWTVDLKDRKIRVNALSPGPIETPGVDGLAETRGGGRADQGRPRRQVPLGRMGDAGRDRQGRRVPRLRRQQLRHRHRAVRRRRDGADLMTSDGTLAPGWDRASPEDLPNGAATPMGSSALLPGIDHPGRPGGPRGHGRRPGSRAAGQDAGAGLLPYDAGRLRGHHRLRRDLAPGLRQGHDEHHPGGGAGPVRAEPRAAPGRRVDQHLPDQHRLEAGAGRRGRGGPVRTEIGRAAGRQPEGIRLPARADRRGAAHPHPRRSLRRADDRRQDRLPERHGPRERARAGLLALVRRGGQGPGRRKRTPPGPMRPSTRTSRRAGSRPSTARPSCSRASAPGPTRATRPATPAMWSRARGRSWSCSATRSTRPRCSSPGPTSPSATTSIPRPRPPSGRRSSRTPPRRVTGSGAAHLLPGAGPHPPRRPGLRLDPGDIPRHRLTIHAGVGQAGARSEEATRRPDRIRSAKSPSGTGHFARRDGARGRGAGWRAGPAPTRYRQVDAPAVGDTGEPRDLAEGLAVPGFEVIGIVHDRKRPPEFTPRSDRSRSQRPGAEGPTSAIPVPPHDSPCPPSSRSGRATSWSAATRSTCGQPP